MLPLITSWLKLLLLLVSGLEPRALRCKSLLKATTNRLSNYQLPIALFHKLTFVQTQHISRLYLDSLGKCWRTCKALQTW